MGIESLQEIQDKTEIVFTEFYGEFDEKWHRALSRAVDWGRIYLVTEAANGNATFLGHQDSPDEFIIFRGRFRKEKGSEEVK